MKFKTKKSHSLVLKKGKLVNTHFTLCGEEIQSIQDQHVIKNLERWYTEELKDTMRAKEIAQQVSATWADWKVKTLVPYSTVWTHAENHVATDRIRIRNHPRRARGAAVE